MAAKLLSFASLSIGLLLATSAHAAATSAPWSTTTRSTTTAASTVPTTTPSAAPPAMPTFPPTAPFGITSASPNGSAVTTCFGIDTIGPLIEPADAMALVQLYNSTICSGNPILTLQAQEGIVLSLGGNQLVFKNQVQFPITPPTCEETVEDFVTIVNTCFAGLPAYGGRLVDHVFSNYVIGTTAQGLFI